MSAVDSAIAEMEAALAAIVPVHEGLRNFSWLNLPPEMQSEVQQAIGAYDRRVMLLTESLRWTRQLVADGYPVLEDREVTPDVFAELKKEAAEIDAALKIFITRLAAQLGLAADDPVLK